MKIAIVAFHFKPEEAIGAVRPENWAAWLSGDHEVVVVTRPFPGDTDVRESRYRIVRASSPAVRLIDRLNRWRKDLRVRRARRDDGRSKAPVARHGDKPGVPSGAFVYRMPCLHDLWYGAAVRALRQENPDLVIATHSPYVSLLAAATHRRRHPHCRLWLDFRDLWSEGHLTRGLPLLRQLERRLEDRALGRADIVSSVSQGYLSSFSARVPDQRRALVYNAPTETVLETAPGKAPGTALTICYTGSIYKGFRDPTPLLEMCAGLRDEGRLRPERVRIVIASRMPGDLPGVVAATGAGDFVDFLGAVPRRESLQLQQDADVLLLLESGLDEADGTMTAKVFEYLATDKPILLLGPGPGSELYRLIDGHGRLLSLEQLRDVMLGRGRIADQSPVNYSAIARRQLFDALGRLPAS